MSQTTTSILRRISDQLVAPRASRGELLVVYTTAVAGSALAVVLAVDSGMSPLSSAVVAVVVPGFGWTAAAAIYGLVVAGALVVLAAPARLRQPVAFGTTTLALTTALAGIAVPAALVWFAPVMLIKLLLGHLLPGEAGP